MADNSDNKYLDYNGLKIYDGKIKEWAKELDEPIDASFVTNNSVGALLSGTSIKETDTLASLIMKMLVSVKDATLNSNPTMNELTNAGGTAVGSYEVGTTIRTDLKTSFKDGAFNSYKAGSNTQTEVITAGCVATGPTYILKNASDASVDYEPQGSFVLKAGTATITGSYSYAASTAKAKKSDGSESTISIKPGSVSKNLTWTGYYCRFEGKFEDGALPDSFTRENLTNKGRCVKGDITDITMPTRYYVIAIPNEFSISAAVNVDSANASIMGSIMNGYPKQINVADAGEGTHAYKLYIFDAGVGSGNNQIKITLK